MRLPFRSSVICLCYYNDNVQRKNACRRRFATDQHLAVRYPKVKIVRETWQKHRIFVGLFGCVFCQHSLTSQTKDHILGWIRSIKSPPHYRRTADYLSARIAVNLYSGSFIITVFLLVLKAANMPTAFRIFE